MENGPEEFTPTLHAPEPLWPPAELARKQELLAPEPLTPQMEQALRCAECIFARLMPDNTAPTFMNAEISRCTEIRVDAVSHYMRSFLTKGLLAKEDPLASTHQFNTNRLSAIYKLPELDDDKQLFRPATKPGCSRTYAQDLSEALKPEQSKVLGALAHFLVQESGPPKFVTQAMVREHAGLTYHVKAVTNTFGTLRHKGVLIPTEAQRTTSYGSTPVKYTYTEQGVWLLSQYPPLERQAASPAPERQPFTVADIHPDILEKVVATFHPNVQTKVLEMLVDHINIGVLDGGIISKSRPGRPRVKAKPLSLSRTALGCLDDKGKMAVPYYLGIDPLIGKQRPTATYVARALEAPANTNLASFIAERYYVPMRRYLKELDA